MTTKDNALRMAIEFIESTASFIPTDYDHIGIDTVNACKAALSEPVTLPEQTAKQKYDNHMKGLVETSAIERLRFFCSLSMSGQDWLDAEQFFNDLNQEKSVTLPDGWVSDERRMNYLSNGGWEVLQDPKYWTDELNLRQVIDRNIAAPTCEKEKG